MTAMLNPAPRWSHARGNTVVPSRWQATFAVPLAGEVNQRSDHAVGWGS
jgi:hypothetical protein